MKKALRWVGAITLTLGLFAVALVIVPLTLLVLAVVYVEERIRLGPNGKRLVTTGLGTFEVPKGVSHLTVNAQGGGPRAYQHEDGL